MHYASKVHAAEGKNNSLLEIHENERSYWFRITNLTRESIIIKVKKYLVKLYLFKKETHFSP